MRAAISTHGSSDWFECFDSAATSQLVSASRVHLYGSFSLANASLSGKNYGTDSVFGTTAVCVILHALLHEKTLLLWGVLDLVVFALIFLYFNILFVL